MYVLYLCIFTCARVSYKLVSRGVNVEMYLYLALGW